MQFYIVKYLSIFSTFQQTMSLCWSKALWNVLFGELYKLRKCSARFRRQWYGMAKTMIKWTSFLMNQTQAFKNNSNIEGIPPEMDQEKKAAHGNQGKNQTLWLPHLTFDKCWQPCFLHFSWGQQRSFFLLDLGAKTWG